MPTTTHSVSLSPRRAVSHAAASKASDEVRRKRRVAAENPVYAARYPEIDRIASENGVQLLEGNVYRNVPVRHTGLSKEALIRDP